MNYEIPNEYKRFVEQEIAAGTFNNTEELVKAALAKLKSDKEEEKKHHTWMVGAINKGLKSLKEGRFYSDEEVKDRMKARKKAREQLGISGQV